MIRAFAITGPTASGKTALSLLVAEAFGCEIISCDSMQIYKLMDIGTAKATAQERARVPHHLLDIISPTESYSAEDYRADAMRVAREIAQRGKIPLFVGGTGLYIDTLKRESTTAPAADPAVRMRLTELASGEDGAKVLWERLMEVDPESAEKMHPNNLRRVIRALEIYESTGITKTEHDRMSARPSSEIEISHLTLDFEDRDLLYSRIDRRVDIMLEQGLVGEVEDLLRRGLLLPDTTAAQAIGYKELIGYLQNECSLADAILQIKLSSRRYAKRQLTWFRHTDAFVLMADKGGRMKPEAELAREAVSYLSAN